MCFILMFVFVLCMFNQFTTGSSLAFYNISTGTAISEEATTFTVKPLPVSEINSTLSKADPEIPFNDNIPYETIEEIQPSYFDKGAGQRIVVERELERERNPSWKKYFPEILAGIIILVCIIIFICWYNYTKRGSETLHNMVIGGSEYEEYMRTRRSRGGRHSSYMLEKNGNGSSRQSVDYGYSQNNITLSAVKPLKCPKPSCICDTKGKALPKGKRKWNYKEDNESYGPATKPV